MHPVLEHILSRKDREIPVADGRKIGLCLYGGIMAGIRGIGAQIALEEMGLSRVFDVIFSYSAGFPNAAYFLAGENRLAASVYYQDLPREKFINFFRIWNIASIKILINILSSKKILPLEKVFQSKTLLYNRFLKNNNKIEYKEVHEMGKDFWKYMEAATSSSFVSPGKISINKDTYKDISIFGNDWKDHLDHAIKSDLTDILVIYNYSSQAKEGRPKSDKIFEVIPPSSWAESRFETNPQVLKENCIQMGNYVKSLFGDKTHIKLEDEKYGKIDYNGKIDSGLPKAIHLSAKGRKFSQS